jgi:hypothetical protein
MFQCAAHYTQPSQRCAIVHVHDSGGGQCLKWVSLLLCWAPWQHFAVTGWVMVRLMARRDR